MYYVYIPLLVLVFLVSCRLLFGKGRIQSVVNAKCNFPLSSGVWTAAFAWQSALFALATIRPLDELLYASRPYHRSPLQGTHGDRVAGDNTRSRHNLRHFSYCATSLCAPATQQHGAVACTLRQVRRSIRSPPCGSCSVFEVTHSVYKYAPNKFSFRAQSKNFVILSEVEGSRGNGTTNFFCARATIINYSLLIINFYAVAARVPSSKLHIPCISAP